MKKPFAFGHVLLIAAAASSVGLACRGLLDDDVHEANDGRGGPDGAAGPPETSVEDAGRPGLQEPSCEYHQPFGTAVVIENVNSSEWDGSPSLTGDELNLYFHSWRSGPPAIYLAARPTRGDPFRAPVPVSELNSGDTSYPALSENELTIYFATNRTGSVGSLDIWSATRATKSGRFGGIVNVKGVNTIDEEYGPFVRVDVNELWFSSGRPAKLYRAPASGSSFGPAEEVSELNATGEGATPILTRDGLTIYFASSRPGGLGGTDIWMAHRQSPNGSFGDPVDVTELNTADRDYPGPLSRDGCRMYLWSTRDWSVRRTSDKDFDLFVAERLPR